MGTCTSKHNDESELRIAELENYGMDQAAKLIKLYKDLEIEKKKTVVDTRHIHDLTAKIEKLYEKYDSDIFVYMDTLEQIQDITKSALVVNRPSSSSCHLVE